MKIEPNDVVGLYVNGELRGVFSCSDRAREQAHLMDYGTFQIMPIGTFLPTDLDL